MIVIKLQEGLGNQLFQYGFGLFIQSHINESVYFDTSFYAEGNTQNVHNRKFELENFRTFLDIRQFDPAKQNVSKFDYVIYEKDFVSDPEEFFNWYKDEQNKNKVIYLVGYWQNIKYLTENRKTLQELFRPNVKTLERIYSKEIIDLVKQGITIHVRRGDYLKLDKIHPIQNTDYYKTALEKLGGQNLEVFILTDDIAFCKSDSFLRNFNLLSEPEALQIRSSNPNFQFNPLYEFQLMQIARYNICSNSTFSWWASFLNKSGGHKSVMPTKWFGPDSDYVGYDFEFEETVKL